MKEVQVKNEETPLEVQSIENKGDGVVIVKVKVTPEANKEKIHQDFNEVYQLKLAAMEAKYKGELNAKDVEIQSYRRENGNMQRTIEILANRTTINVTNSQFGGGLAGGDYQGDIENIKQKTDDNG
ncbi:MAG: hypothetical protein AB4041_15510 [Microcystaceae cyanobacterium]